MRLTVSIAFLAMAPLLVPGPAPAQVGPSRPPVGTVPPPPPFETDPNPTPGGGPPRPTDGVPGGAEDIRNRGLETSFGGRRSGGSRPILAGAPTGPAPRLSGSGFDFQTTDVTAWQYWWSFNRDPYLNLRRRVHHGPWSPTGDELSFGRDEGDADPRPFAPTEAQLRDKILPALVQTLQSDPSTIVAREALLSLGRIGAQTASDRLERYVRPYLSHSNLLVAEAAVVALGLLGSHSAVLELVPILSDTKAGRELCGGAQIPARTRALAAYALGLAAERSDNPDVRRYIAHNLERVLAEDADGQDLFIATTHALALTGADPSLSGKVAESLLALFDNERLGQRRRAHLAHALGALAEGADAETRELLGKRLVRALERRQGEPAEVRQSAALALGCLVDSDEDELDDSARAALGRAAGDPDQLTRRFALIALARAAGRAGDGSGHSFAGLEPARKVLLTALTENRNGVEAWAALALGVLGHRLGEERVSLSSDVNLALAKSLSASKQPDDIGAYALALGLRGDRLSRPMVRERLATLDGRVGARGMCALGLGLSGAREALGELQRMLPHALNQPELFHQLATAIALIGDPGLSLRLEELLGGANSQAHRTTILAALGFVGDKRAVDPLVATLGDADLTEFTRAEAARGLGIMAERTDLPWRTAYAVDANYGSISETWTNPGGTGILDYP